MRLTVLVLSQIEKKADFDDAALCLPDFVRDDLSTGFVLESGSGDESLSVSLHDDRHCGSFQNINVQQRSEEGLHGSVSGSSQGIGH